MQPKIQLHIVQQPSEVQIPWFAWCAKTGFWGQISWKSERIGYSHIAKEKNRYSEEDFVAEWARTIAISGSASSGGLWHANHLLTKRELVCFFTQRMRPETPIPTGSSVIWTTYTEPDWCQKNRAYCEMAPQWKDYDIRNRRHRNDTDYSPFQKQQRVHWRCYVGSSSPFAPVGSQI